MSPAMIALIGAVIAVLVLLANNAGLAIIVASLVIPTVAIVELTRRDAFEEEPLWATPAMIGWGAVVGILMAIAMSSIASEWWVDGATLHVGAAGFGGAAAEAAGRPGVGVLLLNGVVLPAVGLTLAAMGPYSLRRNLVFRNEVMDGITLGVAAGSGLATGTTIVYVWPLVRGEHPNGGSVADWTAMLIGVLVTRPIIFGLAVGLICAGIWHVALTQKSVDLSLPVAAGVGGAILFTFGDLLIQPSGTRWELTWHVLIAIGLGIVGKAVFQRAIAQDRMTALRSGRRVVCSACGANSPAGLFCARCGAPLPSATTSPAGAAPDAETGPIDIPSAEPGAANSGTETNRSPR
jgi:hypothetical protein